MRDFMKKVLSIVIFFIANLAFSMEDNPVRLKYTLIFDCASNTKSKQDRFSKFVAKGLEEIYKLKEISTPVIATINKMLTKYCISLRIREHSEGSIACFAHNLTETDFDVSGFITDDAMSKIKRDGLNIDINCKYAGDTRSFVLFNKNKEQELWCETSYCGNVVENKATGLILREIGVTLCPFYVILFHELLHLNHFLDTVDFPWSSDSKDKGFIPYGKALSVQNINDYKLKLTKEQINAFGDIAEFEDDIFVEQLYNDLKSIANDSVWQLNVIQEDKAMELKSEGLTKDDKTKKYLWKREEINLSIVKQLAAYPDWENLEEIRTVFGSKQNSVSEDSIREMIGLPPRGIYGIPQTKRYVLNSMMQKRYGEEKINREYSIGMSSARMGESESAYVPLLVRLLSCNDQVILRGAQAKRGKISNKTLELVRSALNAKFDPDMEVSTPARTGINRMVVADKEERITPLPSEDESE